MRCNLILASLIAFVLCGCAGMADGMSKAAGLAIREFLAKVSAVR